MPRSVRDSYIFPICSREFEVLRVFSITPAMRRVVLGGDVIKAHVDNGCEIPEVRSLGFDDHIKMIFPDPITGKVLAPTNTAEGISWPEGSFDYARTYTVRSLDVEAGEMVVDFVVHGTGLATTWASRCQVGDKITVAGPKMSLTGLFRI